MSDDAIQDLLDDLNPLVAGRQAFRRAQAQHTANRDVIASLRSSLDGRAAEVTQLKATLESLHGRIAVLSTELEQERAR